MTSHRSRRIAYAVGGLLVLLAVAAAVLLATFDANRYKAMAVDWMQAKHQRTLAIDGPLSLSVFPRLALQVSGVRLSERGRAEEFLAVEEARLALELWPLLSGRLVIGGVSARGVRASVQRDAEGVRNVDSLLQGETAGAAPGGAPLAFDIRALQLDDLRLRWHDERLGAAGEVAVQSLATGRLAHRAEAPVSLRATVQLAQPQAATLALQGRMVVQLDLQQRTVAVTALELDVRGDAIGVSGLALRLEGAAGWDGHTLSATALRAALTSATVGGIALGPSTLSARRVVLGPTGGGAQRLELEALSIALTGRQDGAPFEFALDWPRGVMAANAVSGSALSGRVQRGGPMAVAGGFRAAAPMGRLDALRLPGFALELQGRAGTRGFDGSAQADVVLDVGGATASFERLALRATVTAPGHPPLPVELAGTARAGARVLRWAVDGLFDASRFDSSGQVSFAGPVPVVEASARFDRLDLDRLRAADKPAPEPAAAATPSDTPVNLGGLGAVAGRLGLAVGALSLRPYRVDQLRLDAALDQGVLRVERLAGHIWGGRVEASGSADSRSHRLALRLAAQDVDVDALLKDVAGKSLLEGTGRVEADLAAAGTSLGALRSSLAGTVSLRVRDGAIKGFDLTRAMQQARAAGLPQDRISKASAVEKTTFQALSASARVAGGVATSDDLDLTSPLLHVGGAGRFDIGRGRIDYTARASVVAVPKVARGSAEWAAVLRGVTVPVLLSGPFDAIDWKVQWSGVAATALGGTLRELIRRELGARPDTAPAPAGKASAPTAPMEQLRRQLEGLLK